MPLSETDLDAILAATGQSVTIRLSGALVKTITGKFRQDYEDLSPYDASVATLIPVVLVKTSDLTGITTSHTFTIGGTAYVAAGPFQARNDGFSLIRLATNI